jgi:hypothetical protein
VLEFLELHRELAQFKTEQEWIKQCDSTNRNAFVRAMNAVTMTTQIHGLQQQVVQFSDCFRASGYWRQVISHLEHNREAVSVV